MATRSASASPRRAQRADARRNVERILEAAVDELAQDTEASMAAVARRAGVVRATLYVHFPTREELVRAVTERAMEEASERIRAAAPSEGEPTDALERVLATTWRTLGRYHALVAINTRLEPKRLRALHEPVLGELRPLIERGQASGAFNPSVPLDWLLTVILELVHAASREVRMGSLPEDAAERALVDSVAGAVSSPGARRRR